MTPTRPAIVASLAAAALITATAAAEAQRRQEPQRQRQPTRAEVMLFHSFPVGLRLAVVSVNGRRPVANDRPAFTFTPGLRMTGFGGCNPVSADYRRNAGPSDIRFGPLNFIERKCGGEVDRQERAIFWAIQGATRWRPHGARGMTFTGVRGTVTFEPAF
ncbi:MAG: META domain-containing protein [Phreatobacter sp.]|uniref:META domain-containing protein n=1 Tax=Phreatobacter sp. TaxID=1966341 RepID=UPI002732DB28|nr:META domain-containing protein [Phreatobacter sp.]MDP2803829.1 META domain-containing protein [Phreatobacter sp.]